MTPSIKADSGNEGGITRSQVSPLARPRNEKEVYVIALSCILSLLILATITCRSSTGYAESPVRKQIEIGIAEGSQNVIDRGLAEPNPSISRSHAVFQSDGSRTQFGVVAKLGNQETADDRQITLMKQLGVTEAVWTPGEWATTERKPGKYALSREVERVLIKLKEAGLRSVIVLFRKNPIYPNPLDAAARYCGWMARALKGFPIAAFQIWNEPSNFDLRDYHSRSWNARGNAMWLSHFVKMMVGAASAIRAESPNAKIIANLEGPPLLRALAHYPQSFQGISGASLHPYSGILPPESVPWGGPPTDLRDGVTLADANGSLISTLRIQTRDAPRRYLGRSFEAWITEYGYPTCDPNRHPKQFLCVTPAMQAAYDTRGLLVGLSQQVNLWTIYELADEGNDPSDPEQNFGLVRSAADDFAPKPSFYSLQRVYHLLGHKWRYMTQPPDGIVVSSWIGLYSSSSNSPIEGPQLLWFKVDNGYLAFLWLAGPYQQQDAGERLVLETSAEFSSDLRAIDLATGDTIRLTKSLRSNQARSIEFTVISNPIAMHFVRASPSHKSIECQPIGTRPIRTAQVLRRAST